IAFEYLEGQTLRETLKSGAVAVNIAIDIALQIGEGLKLAHQSGIIHKQIKPENIFIGERGVVKILDFGLAKFSEADTSSPAEHRKRGLFKTEEQPVVATVQYLSPEQVQSLPLDHRCDIFSFGILLYEMFSARVPFEGSSALETAYKIIGVTAQPLELDDPSAKRLQSIIDKCLHKSPELRFQDTQTLLRELQEIRKTAEPDFKASRVSTRTDSGSTVYNSCSVVYFENLTQDPELNWLKQALIELFTARLSTNMSLKVASSEQIADLVFQLEPDLEELDKTSSLQISKQAETDVCITGSFARIAGNLSISVHLYETSSGKLINWIYVKRLATEDLFESIFSIVDEIGSKIERELKVYEGEGRKISEILTNSLVALNAFLSAVNLYRKSEWIAAKEQFEAATAADPQFVLPYFYLARIERFFGQLARKSNASSIKTALEKVGKLNERERRLILLEHAATQRNYATLLKIAEDTVNIYPTEKLGYIYLGESYRWRAESQRAFVVFQQAISLDQKLPLQLADGFAEGIFSGETGSIMESYFETDRFEAAEELARKQVSIFPGNWLAHQLLAITLYHNGHYYEAEATFKKASSLAFNQHLYPEIWQARLAMLSGNFPSAEDILKLKQVFGQEISYVELEQIIQEMEITDCEKAIYWSEIAETYRERGMFEQWLTILNRHQQLFSRVSAKEDDFRDPRFSPNFWRPVALEQTGQLDKVIEHYKDLSIGEGKKLQETLWGKVHLARLLACCGRHEEAEMEASKVEQLDKIVSNPKIEQLSLFVRASIAFYSGNYQQAVEMLERSISSYYSSPSAALKMLAQCYRQLKRYDEALELLEKVKTFCGVNSYSGRFLTRSQIDLEIAKTYEAKLDKDKALLFYTKCLSSWKNADKDFVGKLEAEAGRDFLTRK
ncbi:MAG: protein kinase, partial [Blastocatellia bacterium]|nr:protein kinase [Blastocatellia bacterium]